jgi:hypothetical protein
MEDPDKADMSWIVDGRSAPPRAAEQPDQQDHDSYQDEHSDA